jgi:hypothetical protein
MHCYLYSHPCGNFGNLVTITRMKVAAGVRLAIAVTKVAEVNFIASTYKFWFIVNLHTYKKAYNKMCIHISHIFYY